MIHIEEARPDDFLEVAALDRIAWQQTPSGTYIPDGEHVWRIWCEHALVQVARTSQQKIVGAALAFPCTSGKYCLHKALVAHEARGQGVGGQLFAALLKHLDALRATTFLTVDPDNTAAIRLYRKWGFGEDQLIRGFYRANEDRLILTRPSHSTPA